MPKLRQPGPIFLLIAIIALLVAGAVLLYVSFQHSFTIGRDGAKVSLRGSFDTVQEAIDASGIETNEYDFIWPPLDAAPPADGRITIVQAHSVELTVDGQTTTRPTHQERLASFLAEQEIALSNNSTITVDGQQVTLADLNETRLGRTIEISSQAAVHVEDGQESLSLLTGVPTVGQSLIEAGIVIYAADSVEPTLASWLQDDQRIVIERATPVTVDLGQSHFTARTSQHDVAGVLAELGVGLIGRDQTFPLLEEEAATDQQISVQRASSQYELVESSLPYSSQMMPLDTLEIDQRSLVSAGSPGMLSQVKRIETLGSGAISPTETVIGQWIARPPTDEVIGYGTNIVIRTLDTPQGPIEYWRVVRMRVTSYTAASAGKPPDHPGYGITASGRRAGYGVVAIDPNVVPFRSQVYVPGYGVAYAGDTGGGVKGRMIDLGYDDGELVSWRGYVDVYYLTPVPEAARINYLIPTALP